MDSRTEERVKDWDSRPFSAGYEDLRELADAEFSGAVETGSTTCFLLNGRVVGVVGGDIESFEDASGTIYEAPHPSLPLLFAMRERGGEERAKYYTNDTPISEADGTLSSGSFTGYIELSENVLSGDYYVVYYGGRSMSCAFVGNQEKLLTDDEAFDRADDEVGIYTVWDVDVDVQDIPDVDEDEDEGRDAVGAADPAAGAGVDVADADEPVSTGTEDVSDVGDGAPSAGTDDAVGSRTSAADAALGVDDDEDTAPQGDGSAPTETESVVAEAEPGAPTTDSPRRADGQSDPSSNDADGKSTGSRDARKAVAPTTDPGQEDDRANRRRDPRVDEPSDGRDPVEPTSGDEATGSAMAEVPDEVMAEVEDEARASEFDDEVAWRETTQIPSINPDRTTESDDGDPLAARESSSAGSRRTPDREPASNGGRNARSNGDTATDRTGSQSAPTKPGAGGIAGGAANAGGTGGAGGVDPDEHAALEATLAEVREERDAVKKERAELEEARDDLQERNQELQARVEELEAEVADLETELATARERLEAADTRGVDASVELSPREALEGTNLFVRYGSKSATTMEDVHDSDVSVADLESNLRLEYHTGFDAADAVVDGVPYDDFLYDSTPYQFVEWFVYDLVFEVRDTGNESALGDLYEAFPKVDRIELYGDVSLRYDDGGEEHREQTTFDVVVRDRMGNPLAVANVNDSRAPATEDMMVDLEERSSRVKRTSDALAGAFMVTASYFEPGALETANEATSGGILSRDSKKSYVKLSRKRGYHLCLVETRNGEFHVNVPEL
jgi:hypothetical protein